MVVLLDSFFSMLLNELVSLFSFLQLKHVAVGTLEPSDEPLPCIIRNYTIPLQLLGIPVGLNLLLSGDGNVVHHNVYLVLVMLGTQLLSRDNPVDLPQKLFDSPTFCFSTKLRNFFYICLRHMW